MDMILNHQFWFLHIPLGLLAGDLEEILRVATAHLHVDQVLVKFMSVQCLCNVTDTQVPPIFEEEETNLICSL